VETSLPVMVYCKGIRLDWQAIILKSITDWNKGLFQTESLPLRVTEADRGVRASDANNINLS